MAGEVSAEMYRYIRHKPSRDYFRDPEIDGLMEVQNTPYYEDQNLKVYSWRYLEQKKIDYQYNFEVLGIRSQAFRDRDQHWVFFKLKPEERDDRYRVKPMGKKFVTNWAFSINLRQIKDADSERVANQQR